MFCTCLVLLSRIPARIHSGTPGSGHATSIDQLQSLETGPAAKWDNSTFGAKKRLLPGCFLHH